PYTTLFRSPCARSRRRRPRRERRPARERPGGRQRELHAGAEFHRNRADGPDNAAPPGPGGTPGTQDMTIRIDKKIKGYSVVRPDEQPQAAVPPTVQPDPADSIDVPTAQVIQMHERVERPERLEGVTYKIKSPLFEHALYVTINDIVLNE